MEDTVKGIRLSKAAKELNVGIQHIVDFLHKKGITVDSNPNTKLSQEAFAILTKAFQSDIKVKEEAQKIGLDAYPRESISIDDKVLTRREAEPEEEPEELFIKKTHLDLERPKTEKTRKEIKAPKKPVEPAPEAKEEKPQKPAAETPAVPSAETEPVPVPAAAPEPASTDDAVREESKVKILGKIDLESLYPKKTKGKKKKAEVKEEESTPVGEEKPAVEADAEVKHPEVMQEAALTPAVEEPEQKDIPAPEVKPEPETPPREDPNFIRTRTPKLEGPVILGKIELPVEKKPVASSSDDKLKAKKKKRKRIKKQIIPLEQEKTDSRDGKIRKGPGQKRGVRDVPKAELSDEEVQKQIRETLARLSGTGKSKASKYRRQKRELVSQHMMEEQARQEEEKKNIKCTEFVTANELAIMMNVAVTQVISTCMQLGLMVSINQRLDAETIVLVADEFGYKVEFVGVEVQEAIGEIDTHDEEGDLLPRPPIVTVMGHVDHGKTLLLDYIRKTNVVAGEAGGITQHIGAYEVLLDGNRKITFLDTPGHEAFTAMRARGAKVTDVSIIIIAADDSVMPQTVEAINHAQAAGVPMVFAINKIDKPGANPEKIKEQLANLNLLVEDWGGKYQSQEISAKAGLNIESLLEKVLLEAELLDLKANPNRKALGTIIESSLDKGRGYIAKVLVQNGSLRVGDVILAGTIHGRVKAMYNERNQAVKVAGPSTPVLLLGLTGAPQAGDAFHVMEDEKEAKSIAAKRLQLQREQGIRTQKHITLDEIGRRIAIGDFKELNIIVKGDVDGSVEALSDALLKLSTKQVLVNVIHKSVGQVTESDVLLASASNAIIVAFQVRPSLNARKLAEKEQIDIRTYSIIYTAINEIQSAIEGMLTPEFEEKITCNVEVLEVFKISKVGTVAGCRVLDGKISRNTPVRVIRDGIVVYTGSLGSLKRFKDDVKEVSAGFECGLNIDNFNDVKTGDIIEGYEQVEVRRK
ncbi:MAG TPA: translation initiation factor IF-2 [Bacteroidales bacterium]|nr:translation initiation factor IF-2 [Bacteroidales bacterium]HSA42197.1 translation initiation factor IF-2 [Bacteroidales bacterium]